MYLGIDVGGTKTLLAVFDKNGKIAEEKQFPTPKAYDNFLLELKHAVKHLKTQEFKSGAVGIRGVVDRKHGRRLADELLKWGVVPLQADVEKITLCPIAIENDAKLAGLSEAMELKGKYSKVLYVTLSTGIGYALVVDGKIDANISDGGGQSLMIDHRGQAVAWEDIAGGRAIVEQYGKKASDIDDEATWQEISRQVAKGLNTLIAIFQPEAIVFGGSVGAHFDKYGKILEQRLSAYKIPLVDHPRLLKAKRPEEAVVFGCFELAKQL